MSLIDQYKELHEAGKFPGFSVLQHTSRIGDLCRKHEAKTLLDYGSGKGYQYSGHKLHECWGVEVTCYDPAVGEFLERPGGKFDGVICSDVLEHIPEEDIPSTLDDIFSYAGKFVFLAICTREAKKTLPDGRNCHLTVKDRDWWLEKVGERGLECEVVWNV